METTKIHSNRQADLKVGEGFVTLRQAREAGLKSPAEPPSAGICEFCGRELQPVGIELMGAVIWKPTLPRCDCQRAKEKWAEYDRAEQAKKELDAERKHQREMQEKVDRLLGNSGMKRRFMQRTFQNFKRDTPGREKNYGIAKEYADNFTAHKARGEGLYIEGTNGTGKTHLAAAISLQLIERGIPAIFKTSNDLLLDIRRSYDKEGAKEYEVLETYKKTDLLVVDDLGKEQCTDWSMSILYSILNDRYEDLMPTIITTNYNARELVEALTPKGGDGKKAEAIISRLRETSTVMTMAWKDARLND